ncbi:sorbitol dehydrogenase-like, partial [Ruditapes philippinarum]|uniref:sorbitol dehydrogenase-like n=1 Tax=Ruditapes philippinarum TaxID=129788 RepID=UPI00295B7AAC
DRVAIEPGVPCRCCSYCKKGRYNLCLDMKFCATPPIDGNLARFYEGVSWTPLSEVFIEPCNRGGVTLGSKVLICGAGPIGLVNLLTAKACGAAQICITDLDEKRLEMAKSLGADFPLKVTSKDPREMADKIEECLGEKPEVAIECSGAPPSVKTAIYATSSGGCVVLVGMGPSEVTLPIMDAAVREVDIRGIFRYVNCYPTALNMIASGKFMLCIL